MRPRLAFYGSTPAYKPALDANGFGELQPELNRLTKAGDWKALPSLVTDDVLDAYVTTGTPETIKAKLEARFGGLVDRLALDEGTARLVSR